MEEKIVTLATFYDAGLANISLGRLESEGIPCFLADANISTINPLYNQAVGGIKLKIFERDMERSKEILREDVALISEAGLQAASTDPCTCPACHSSDVG